MDLFPEITGLEVKQVNQFRFERAFQILFPGEKVLLFKIFGRQSNILLYEQNRLLGMFKNNLRSDRSLLPEHLIHEPDLSFEKFRSVDFNAGKFSPVIDKNITEYLNSVGYNLLSQQEQYELLIKTLRVLEDPKDYYVIIQSGFPEFTLFRPQTENFKRFNDIVEALNYFCKKRFYAETFLRQKEKILKNISREIEKSQNYVIQSRHKLDQMKKNADYKRMADIIMANLHNIPPGEKLVTLPDFFSGNPVRISLKPALSPQKNAENYYRKSKNQEIEIRKIEESIKSKTGLIAHLNDKSAEIEKATGLKELKKHAYGRETETGKVTDQPFKKFVFMGYDILVGRNSRNNEKLTFETGGKDDLWLHARDVSGSHVLVKIRPGKVTPRPVIERAAELASYFSKGRGNTVCPVIYTQRKYVRKLKGGKKGEVIADKEKIIFVRPSL